MNKISKGRSRRAYYKNKSSNKNFLLVIFFIFLFGLFLFLYNRYSFTKVRANMNDFYKGVKENEVSVYINDVLFKDENNNVLNKASYENNAVYLPLSWVKSHLNNRFYYATDIDKILYCLPDEVITKGVSDLHQVGNAPYVIKKEEPFLLIEFIADYTNIRFEKYTNDDNKRLFIYDVWDNENYAFLKSNEKARWKGGNKSPIIEDLSKGEQVKILDKMVKWSKVKTLKGYVGYVRNSKLQNEIEKVPDNTFVEPQRETYGIDDKVLLGFHQVAVSYPSNRLSEVLKNAKNMNVIAPTWYSFKNNEGDLRSLANQEYVNYCHNKGLKIWPTVNNFDVLDVNEKEIFSNTFKRKIIINRILREVVLYKLDGINLDIEAVSKDAGEDFVQFVRELSIELNKIKVTFSIDCYIPYDFNDHYNIYELGEFADYIVVMCYDEHTSGSSETGSVSSLKYVSDGINLTMEDVSRNKIVIALPFYTRVWGTDKNGKITSHAYSSEVAEQICKSSNVVFEFNDELGQNYGSVQKSDGSKIECWMEDSTSLTKKMDLIKNYDLAGTAAWKLTFDREDFFDIINLNG